MASRMSEVDGLTALREICAAPSAALAGSSGEPIPLEDKAAKITRGALLGKYFGTPKSVGSRISSALLCQVKGRGRRSNG
jgi:hypothetical protein